MHWKASTTGLDTSLVRTTGGNYMVAGDDSVIEFTHAVYDAAGNATQEHTFEANHNDTNGLDMTANDDYVRRSVYRSYDAVNRLLVVVDYGAGDASGAGEAWRYVAVPGTTSGATSLATTFGYFYGDDPYTSGVTETGYSTSVFDPAGVKTKSYFDKLYRRTFVAENFVNFAVPSTGIGGGTNNDNDRVTKWEYNGLDDVTKLTAYNAGASDRSRNTCTPIRTMPAC